MVMPQSRYKKDFDVASQDRVDEFIGLFTSTEPRLRAYVLTLVPRAVDADDIMQRSNMILWQKFDAFETGTNFFAWACSIARFEVKKSLAQLGREKATRVVFSDAFIDRIAGIAETMVDELPDRRNALQHCLEKLPAPQRKLVGLRYIEGNSIESIAATLNRSHEAMYKALSRIRHQLFDCVTRTLAVKNP
jgi:RNA polymerase sigma-70 factor, ECF subfamily